MLDPRCTGQQPQSFLSTLFYGMSDRSLHRNVKRDPEWNILDAPIPKRKLTEEEKKIVEKNGSGTWHMFCCEEDCFFASDSSAIDISTEYDLRRSGYIFDCAQCKTRKGVCSQRCATHLYECDACGDYVCKNCVHEFSPLEDEFRRACKCKNLLEEEENVLFICPKHYRPCENCDETKCFCDFKGASVKCRECEKMEEESEKRGRPQRRIIDDNDDNDEDGV